MFELDSLLIEEPVKRVKHNDVGGSGGSRNEPGTTGLDLKEFWQKTLRIARQKRINLIFKEQTHTVFVCDIFKETVAYWTDLYMFNYI